MNETNTEEKKRLEKELRREALDIQEAAKHVLAADNALTTAIKKYEILTPKKIAYIMILKKRLMEIEAGE